MFVFKPIICSVLFYYTNKRFSASEEEICNVGRDYYASIYLHRIVFNSFHRDDRTRADLIYKFI